VVVISSGRLVGELYASGFTPDMPLAGWSMNKSALSALVGSLVAEGLISPTDRDLLPAWRAPNDPRRAIALDDLLRMRSGLRFDEVYTDPLSDVTQMLFASPDAAAYAASRPLLHPPGTVWAYSSGTSNIVSSILRLALKDRPRDYESLPRRALFDPLGMRTAIMEPDASGTFVTSSFMYASARDWAKLGQLFLQRGEWGGRQILPKTWVDYCLQPTPQSRGGCYAAHWWRKLSREFGGESPAALRIPADAFHAMGHEGQVLSVVPSRGVVVVRLGLSVHGDAWNHAEFLVSVLDALA
jgi:CubicO group peptidase (beta-lactamase class C family)